MIRIPVPEQSVSGNIQRHHFGVGVLTRISIWVEKERLLSVGLLDLLFVSSVWHAKDLVGVRH